MAVRLMNSIYFVVSLTLMASANMPAVTDVGGFFKDNDGLPFIPFGFYQYTVHEPLDVLTTTEEAVHGMNLACPFVVHLQNLIFLSLYARAAFPKLIF